MSAAGIPFPGLEVDPLIAEAKRRARRRRLIAAGVVLLAAGVTGGVVLSSGAGRGSGAVPWLPTRPNIGPANPPLAPPCAASQLRGTLGIQGATGNLAGLIWLTNRSHSACALVGRPKLSFIGATSKWQLTRWRKVLGQPAYDPLTPRPNSLRALLPGRSAATYVFWSNWCGAGSRRNGDSGRPPSAITVAAPGGGRVVLGEDRWGNHPLGAPPCYAPLPSRMAVTKFTPYVPQGQQSSALPLTAKIAPVGAFTPGRWLAYTVILRNRSPKTFSFGSRCPAYYEDFGGRPLAYILNCHAVGGIAPHGAVRFAMRIRVPRGTPANTLTWVLAPHSWGGGVLAQLSTVRP
jgi:hypothetical protein